MIMSRKAETYKKNCFLFFFWLYLISELKNRYSRLYLYLYRHDYSIDKNHIKKIIYKRYILFQNWGNLIQNLYRQLSIISLYSMTCLFFSIQISFWFSNEKSNLIKKKMYNNLILNIMKAIDSMWLDNSMLNLQIFIDHGCCNI